jgi:hypothetical protein
MVRWPILVGPGLCVALLASPAPADADAPLYTCAKAAPDAKLTIPFTPDRTLHDLGVWVTGFTCKSVVYDREAAARATKLALIAPSSVTPKPSCGRGCIRIVAKGIIVELVAGVKLQ